MHCFELSVIRRAPANHIPNALPIPHLQQSIGRAYQSVPALVGDSMTAAASAVLHLRV